MVRDNNDFYGSPVIRAFEKDKVTLFNTDWLNEEVGNSIPNASVSLVVCDLPYGVTQNPMDIAPTAETLSKLWEEWWRVLKPNGAVLLFGQGMFSVNLINSQSKHFKYDLVWDKGLTTDFLNANRRPLRRHEQILVFYKSQPTYNPQMTEGKPLHGKGTACFEEGKELKNQNYGKFKPLEHSARKYADNLKYPTSIITVKKAHPSQSVHPTEKPVALLEWLIKSYTNIGEVVADYCMGGGSSGIAAVATNRKFIGIELNPNHFAVASQRIYEKVHERELLNQKGAYGKKR